MTHLKVNKLFWTVDIKIELFTTHILNIKKFVLMFENIFVLFYKTLFFEFCVSLETNVQVLYLIHVI